MKRIFLLILFIGLVYPQTKGGAGSANEIDYSGKDFLAKSLTFDVGATINEFSVDDAMTGNSDDAVPTESTVVTYTAAQLAAYTGSGNLVTVGTIGTGVWNAGAITSSGDILANTSNYVIEGYATGRSVDRVMSFRISPGTTPGTDLTCIDVNVAGNEYNPATTTDGTDLAKEGSEGSWTLSANGKQLIVSPTETVIGTAQPTIDVHNLNNSSTTDAYYLSATRSNGGIQFGIRPWGSNVALDWTTILQAGDRLQFKCAFKTSS